MTHTTTQHAECLTCAWFPTHDDTGPYMDEQIEMHAELGHEIHTWEE